MYALWNGTFEYDFGNPRKRYLYTAWSKSWAQSSFFWIVAVDLNFQAFEGSVNSKAGQKSFWTILKYGFIIGITQNWILLVILLPFLNKDKIYPDISRIKSSTQAPILSEGGTREDWSPSPPINFWFCTYIFG